MAASSTEMLMNADGLVVNAYHDAQGRGDYFPGSSGTSEGQFLFIIGNLRAYKATGNPIAKELAELALKNLLRVIYRNAPVPDSIGPTSSFAPHWLFNVKYPFDSSVIHYDRQVVFTNGVGAVASAKVRYVYGARSLDSKLLWDNPYSPLSVGTAYDIASHGYVAGTGEVVTLTTPFTGTLFLTYSDQTGQPVLINEPFEAWPDWRKLEPGEIACAVDVFVWAFRAFILAAEVFNNPTWLDAAYRTRSQASLAFNINDSRDWIKLSWAKSPFAAGSRFSFTNRLPAPRLTVDGDGYVVVTVGNHGGGNSEIQYGNASINDVWGGGDQGLQVTFQGSIAMNVEVFIDPTATYVAANRYKATVAVDLTNRTTLLGRTDFKNPAGAAIPVGTAIYTFGINDREPQAHTLRIGRARQTPNRSIMYSPGAIPFTANFQGSPAQLIDWRGPIYMGYQSPYMWMVLGAVPSAVTNTQMLSDAQVQWREQTGQTSLGPFAPVFIFDRTDAVQYGAPNSFGWEGPDPNTKWGGYQYRPLPELLEAAQNSQPGQLIYNSSVRVARNFLNWLAQDWAWLPMWAPWSDYFADSLDKATALMWTPAAAPVFPVRPAFGPPTDFPKGAAEINYPEPHLAALVLRSVLMLDKLDRPNGNATGAMAVQQRALLSKCMALLDRLWVTSGQMEGTFSPDLPKHEWYGFWHGEILDTLAQAYEHTNSAAVALPSVAAQCKIWIDGMLRWAKSNVQQAPNAYGSLLWKYRPNWSDAITEEFEFSTGIYVAFTGKEQRSSKRIEPRRRLSMRHSLVGADAQSFDAVLRHHQNKPMLVPQWHLARAMLADAPAGQDFLLVDTQWLSTIRWGDNIAITKGTGVFMVKATAVDGDRVILATPLTEAVPASSTVMPTCNALIDQDMSATRRTSTVLEAVAGFRMLPQEDFRTLPVLPAPMTFQVPGDLREVILKKPNWATDPTVGQTWEYNVSDFDNGPVVPINGRSKGARTIQARWTLNGADEINAHLGLVARLRGRRYAAWLPSWTQDFVLTRDITARDRLFVEPNVYLDLGLMADPSVAIFIRTFDGRHFAARVRSFVTGALEYTILLDRDIPGLPTMNQVAMISVLYRVRQVSDTTALKWITTTVAETTASFVSVFDETS